MAGLRYLVQALLALGALALGPNVIETPEETWQQILAGLVALILVGLAYRGVVGFVNSRRPKRFHDSLIAPKQPPRPKD